eukprot:4845681-Pyramimonas_sp.AAC.1
MGPRNVVLGGGHACELRHWDLRWSSHGARKPCTGLGETHSNCATGTFGGAPSGATKRGTGWGRRMRTAPLGPS